MAIKTGAENNFLLKKFVSFLFHRLLNSILSSFSSALMKANSPRQRIFNEFNNYFYNFFNLLFLAQINICLSGSGNGKV